MTQSFTQMINGKLSSSESVDYHFSFVVTADREGEYNIGPFEIVYQGVTKQVKGADGSIRQAGKQSRYPVAARYRRIRSMWAGSACDNWLVLAGEMAAVQYAFSNLQIRSPLFDQFTFKEQPRQSRTALTIATAKGDMEVDAEVTEEGTGRAPLCHGVRLVYAGAGTPGKYASISISCRTKKGHAMGAGLFGDLTALRQHPGAGGRDAGES